MGTNKQTLAKTPPSNITEPNALRVENQICLHLKKKKKTFRQIVSAITSIILQQILTISKPLNHGITLFSQQELPFSQL
jgi:hypothetical protein